MWLAGRWNLPGTKPFSEELSNYLATQSELIKNSAIQHRAYERVRVRFPELPRMEGGTATPLPFQLAAQTTPRGSVLQLQARGPSAEAARAFLEAAMSEYSFFKQEARHQTSVGALASLTEQIKDVERQLEQAQSRITAFQTSNNLSRLTEESQGAGSRLAKLAERIAELRTEARFLAAVEPGRLGGMFPGLGGSLSETASAGNTLTGALVGGSSPARTAYYQALQQLELLKSKRAEFATVLRPAHSKMIRLSQEIAGWEQLLVTLQAEDEQRLLGQLAQRKRSIELQIENLENQYLLWENNAHEATSKLGAYDALKQGSQRLQALYDHLLSLLQAVDLNKSLDQEPLVPMGPASPARPTLLNAEIAGAGIFLALLIGIGLSLGLGIFDDRFVSANEVSPHLREQLVAQVPEMHHSGRNGRSRDGSRLPGGDALAESFRNLRSFLWFTGEANGGARIILVASATPEEGKTTVAVNLARMLATAVSPVLFVDADQRHRSTQPLFGTKAAPGLAEVLSNCLTAEEVILPAAEPNLFGMSAGQADLRRCDGFLNGTMAELLEDLGKRYRYIVIDTAPVLAADDAASLAPKCEGVLLVVRDRFTSAGTAREALERLRQRNAKILGVVYNCAKPTANYYRRYGRGDDTEATRPLSAAARA
jgi:capsular exopolysaccharide synthesis family protein